MVDQDTLKIGDVVQLTSGGAKMTVRRVRAHFEPGRCEVVCHLISDTGHVSMLGYPPECLKLADVPAVASAADGVCGVPHANEAYDYKL